MGLEPASVRASTLSNMNISKTSRPITIKFYLKHHWGGRKAALGFGANQIRTLVSMATDSSHRVIMGKRALLPRKRWLRPDMTEKLLTGMLSLNTNKQTNTFELEYL